MPTATATVDKKIKLTFARHETFHLRDGWLFKGLNAVKSDPTSLYEIDAHHSLGIGINMLKSLMYWLKATNLVEAEVTKARQKPPLSLSDVGEAVWNFDPYFEDVGTLWVLHIELASNRDLASFWYWAFNELSKREFSEDRLKVTILQVIS